MNESHPTAYIFKLIEDRFVPFTRVAGPLYAGNVQLNGSPGSLYLTEAHTWLYNGEELYNIHNLTHEQVSRIGDPVAIVSHLLHAVANTLGTGHRARQRVPGWFHPRRTRFAVVVFYFAAASCSLGRRGFRCLSGREFRDADAEASHFGAEQEKTAVFSPPELHRRPVDADRTSGALLSTLKPKAVRSIPPEFVQAQEETSLGVGSNY